MMPAACPPGLHDESECAPAAEALRRTPHDPSGHVIECGFCGGLAFGVTEGKWSADGRAYTEVLYLHDGCKAVDPTVRSARPALLAAPTPRRRRRLFSRRSS